MADFFARLKQRKLVQWAIAYVAFWFALLQGLDIVATRFDWPGSIERYFILALAIGFCVVLVLAWYHGERGRQRVGGTELLIIALLLAIGGVLIWRFGPAAVRHAPAAAMVATAATARPAGVGAPAAVSLTAQSIPAKSIAVLPFENLSGDKGNEYFVEGMQGMILAKLGDVSDLKVIARTSTANYTSHPQDTRTIGQQLGVATLLEGSVQKVDNQVLIEVRLVDVDSDSQIWAQTYQRTLTNIFGVEGEVAAKVADALKAKLTSVEIMRVADVPTENPVAYDLFLRAEYLSNWGFVSQDTTKLGAAIPLYQKAIAEDPDFALAYARVSFAESALALFGRNGEDVGQLIADARRDAQQALKLAPGLAAAHLALAYSNYWGHDEFNAALKGFVATLALNPNSAYAWLGRGYIERRQGRFDEAIASLKQAFTLDPRDSPLAYGVGYAEATIGRYAEAEKWFRRALALDPHDGPAKHFLAWAMVFDTGDIPRALTVVQDEPLVRVELLTLQRKYQQALAVLGSVPDTPSHFPSTYPSKVLWQAGLYRLMGDKARARPLFAQALAATRAHRPTQQDIPIAIWWGEIAAAQLGLDETAAGLKSISRALAIADQSADRTGRLGVMQRSAALYAQAQRVDLSISLLAKALATPGLGLGYSPVLLWLDPAWDPIRHDPGFQELLKKYAKYKPAEIPVPPASTSGTVSVPVVAAGAGDG